MDKLIEKTGENKMKKIELTSPIEFWGGTTEWRMDHVGPDTVALTNARGKCWIVMVSGRKRFKLRYKWIMLLLMMWSAGMTTIAAAIMVYVAAR